MFLYAVVPSQLAGEGRARRMPLVEQFFYAFVVETATGQTHERKR
jgi:hypothetical protein